MRDPELGIKIIPTRNPVVQTGPNTFARVTRDKLIKASHRNQARKTISDSKWCGYADPVKQAMADAGLIPQSPVIGEVVDTRGVVRTKEAPPRDERVYKGKDNGKPRGEVVIQCTKPQYFAPLVVGSYWPRLRGEDGKLVIRPIYDGRASVELESVVDTGDPTLTANITESMEDFTRGLFEIARKGVAARKK